MTQNQDKTLLVRRKFGVVVETRVGSYVPPSVYERTRETSCRQPVVDDLYFVYGTFVLRHEWGSTTRLRCPSSAEPPRGDSVDE